MIDQDWANRELLEKWLDRFNLDLEDDDRSLEDEWEIIPRSVSRQHAEHARILMVCEIHDQDGDSGTLFSFWWAPDEETQPSLDLLLHDYDSVVIEIYRRGA